MQRETQQTVLDWCTATFGVSPGPLRCLIVGNRMLEEVIELGHLLLHPEKVAEKIEDELADVLILYWQLCSAVGETRIAFSHLQTNFLDIEKFYSTHPYRPSMIHELRALSDAGVEFNYSRMIEAAGSLMYYLHPEGWYWHTVESRLITIRCCIELIAESNNTQLSDAVNKKMSINRNRKWKVGGAGIGQHI